MGNLKCYTLSYDPMGDGFDTGLMDKELKGSDVTVEHAELFSYDGLPRLNLVVSVRPGDARAGAKTKPRVNYRDKLRESDRPLYDSLRQWRRKMAFEKTVPQYLVVSNRALAGIAATRPGSRANLLEVPGVGDVILTRYGDELLDVVRSAA